MKAHELAQRLLAGPNEEVMLTYSFGDHCHTSAAVAIEEVKPTVVKPWPYAGDKRFAVVEDGNDGTFETVEEWREWEVDDLDDLDPDANDAKVVIALG